MHHTPTRKPAKKHAHGFRIDAFPAPEKKKHRPTFTRQKDTHGKQKKHDKKSKHHKHPRDLDNVAV